jgi:hypothetical protein
VLSRGPASPAQDGGSGLDNSRTAAGQGVGWALQEALGTGGWGSLDSPDGGVQLAAFWRLMGKQAL